MKGRSRRRPDAMVGPEPRLATARGRDDGAKRWLPHIFHPSFHDARSKNGGMTPFVERPSPPRALKSTQEPPFPAHRRAGGGSRCVGGLLEVGENGNSWGSTAQPRSVQEGCSWGGDRRHAHPGLPAGNRRSPARTATAGGAGGGDLFDLLPAHGGHDFVIGAGRENRNPASRPRRTPRPSGAPTTPPASTDPGEGAGRSDVPGARSKRQTDPRERDGGVRGMS